MVIFFIHLKYNYLLDTVLSWPKECYLVNSDVSTLCKGVKCIWRRWFIFITIYPVHWHIGARCRSNSVINTSLQISLCSCHSRNLACKLSFPEHDINSSSSDSILQSFLVSIWKLLLLIFFPAIRYLILCKIPLLSRSHNWYVEHWAHSWSSPLHLRILHNPT